MSPPTWWGGGPTPDPDLEAKYARRAPRHHHVNVRIAAIAIFAVLAVAGVAAAVRLLG